MLQLEADVSSADPFPHRHGAGLHDPIPRGFVGRTSRLRRRPVVASASVPGLARAFFATRSPSSASASLQANGEAARKIPGRSNNPTKLSVYNRNPLQLHPDDEASDR
jgi:hypothetical protein